jgi:uncharacterized membrane protein
MKRFFDGFNNLYLVWLVGLSVIAYLRPETMLWFGKDWIFWSLAASMPRVKVQKRRAVTGPGAASAMVQSFVQAPTLVPVADVGIRLTSLEQTINHILVSLHFEKCDSRTDFIKCRCW